MTLTQRFVGPPLGDSRPPAKSPVLTSPVLTTTRYDRVSSLLIAVMAALAIVVVWLCVRYQSNLRLDISLTSTAPIMLVGGDGPPSPQSVSVAVQSPADVTDDPSIVETDSDPQLDDIVSPLLLDSSRAVLRAVVEARESAESLQGRKHGSQIGNRKPLGSGPAGPGNGIPGHLRWYVRFASGGTLAEYARQLDYFQIELGVLKDRRLTCVQNIGSAEPSQTIRTEGTDPRMYMTWRGEGRRKADVALLSKAGVDTSSGMVLHFYSDKAVGLLARAEQAAATRPVQEIRRTYFVVRKAGGGYRFVVTRITY